MTMTENSQKPENTETQSTQNSAELRDVDRGFTAPNPHSEILAELARVRAVFQLRTIELVLKGGKTK